MKGLIYPVILIIGLYGVFYFIISRYLSPKNRSKANIAAWVPFSITIVVLTLISRFTGVSLIFIGLDSENRSTQTYDFYMVFLLLIPTFLFYLDYKIVLYELPQNGTWYCEELQVQLCFDEDGSSFVMKDLKAIPCRIEIRTESKLIYLISNDLFEECVFSGKFLSRTKKKMRIEDRNSQWAYSFIAVDDDGTKRRKKL